MGLEMRRTSRGPETEFDDNNYSYSNGEEVERNERERDAGVFWGLNELIRNGPFYWLTREFRENFHICELFDYD